MVRQGKREAAGAGTHPRWPEIGIDGIHGVHRLREWDAVVDVEAERPDAAELAFVAQPDGTLLVGDDDADVHSFADALDPHVEPPYRCVAKTALRRRRRRASSSGSPRERYEHYVLRAERLDAALWEVDLSPL